MKILNAYKIRESITITYYKFQILENGLMQKEMNKQNTISQNISTPISQLDELAPKVSIQDAFKRFQKQKFYQLKLNRFLKNVKVDRTSAQWKEQLREKFLETAKKYIGVPYDQKYHKPGDKLYSAPLFLDCCALIRQIVFDLRQEFGYTLAKWNQAYQFDLLPDTGLQQKDAKPGDIIFYSATYFDKRLKPFPHNMVHVQIYMGEGKSIGSRWQKGVIQIFDSYKFQSKLYYDIKYHFRSLDAWLQGKFQSHCPEHKWKDDRNGQWLSEKFSVFADPALDDLQLAKNDGKPECRKIMIGKGNNNKLIKKYFQNKSQQNENNNKGPTYVFMQQKDQFSPHYFFKWTQSPGQIDFYSFKQGQQVTNHIANIIQVLASKLQLLKTLQELQIDAETKGYKLTMKIEDFVPKTYRLDVMSDQISFINHKSQGIWIYKPRNLNQGRGIRMIGNIEQFKKQFIQSKQFYLGEYSLNNMLYYKPQLMENVQKQQKQEIQYKDMKHDGLIQQYIQPLLIDERKFDIRCYMFVNSEPNMVLFHPGYLRLTIQKYDEVDIQNQNKLMVHLTNNCFQHKHKDYKEKKQTSIAKWDAIIEQIGAEKTKELMHQMKRILLLTYAAGNRKLMKKRGTYQLLGCDFLVGKDLKPYLLEVNTNPALFTDTKTQLQIIPPVVRNSLEIVVQLFDDSEGNKLKQVESSPQKYGFQMLYSAGYGYAYNMEEQSEKISIKDGQESFNGLLIKRNPQKQVSKE